MSNTAQLLIRLSIGATMVAFGVHQILRPQPWLVYIPAWLERLLPARPESFMRSHGSGNVALGLLFISGFSIVFVSWATVVWWLSILPFALWHDWAIGLRDFAVICAALAVAVSVTWPPHRSLFRLSR